MQSHLAFSSFSDMPIRKLILLLTVFSLLNSGTAVAATDEPKKPKPPCRLQISDAHISTSLLEKQVLDQSKLTPRLSAIFLRVMRLKLLRFD
jgi:hypothetical protein